MPFLLAVMLAVQTVDSAAERIVYFDSTRRITVHSRPDGDAMLFSASLPSGWTFMIRVDGDQDGQWGVGALSALPANRITPDHVYAQTPQGEFCPQYVYSSAPDDPGRVYGSSGCGAFHSAGRVDQLGGGATPRVLISYHVPQAELFGHFSDAHLQTCVWDMRRWDCQFSPTHPYLLPRPPRH
jgi:hypothetical protein